MDTSFDNNGLLPNSERWTVGWGFSTRCDLRCPFCYSAKVRQAIETPELDLTQAEDFLTRNGKFIDAFNFGTGECFLSPTFTLLLKLCNKYASQSKIAVTTNGSFADLSPDKLSIASQCMSECDISLDFAKASEHDNWRGKAGTWKRAIKSIELALKFGFKTSIVMIGTEQTLKEDNIQNLLKIAEAYQVAFRINLYMPTTGEYLFIPSIESVFMALTILKAWSSFVCSSDRLLGSILGNYKTEFSTVVKRSCRILPDGSLSPSTYLISYPWLIKNNLADISLSNMINNDSFTQYNFPPVPAECKKCPALSICKGGSVERRWLWNHSLEIPDPLCPYTDGNEHMVLPILSKKEQIEKWSGPTIHLDYLPTIVALPPFFNIPDG